VEPLGSWQGSAQLANLISPMSDSSWSINLFLCSKNLYWAFVLSRSGSAFLNDSRDMDESLRVSFAFPPVEDWFHPSAAGLRRAAPCAAQFARPSFAFSPRSEHVPLSLARLDLVRNWA